MTGLFGCGGLMWRAELACWSPQPGLLAMPLHRPDGLGRPGRRSTSDVVAQTIDVTAFPAIYALYDSYQLLYIGQTGELGSRLKAHREQTRDLIGRWTTFSWLSPVQLEYDPTGDSQIKVKRGPVTTTHTEVEWREALETFAIALAIPRINSQLALSNLGATFTELRQKLHPEAPSKTEDLLAELIWRR
jgi:hypothetical protein